MILRALNCASFFTYTPKAAGAVFVAVFGVVRFPKARTD